MSAMTPTMDLSRTPQVPFSTLVKVELRKAFDTVASFWLVASIVILVVIVDGFVLIATLVQSSTVDLLDFTEIAGGVTSLLLPILGIMLVTTEWSQRTAMVTFTLEARRPRVISAKVTAALTLTVAMVVSALVVGIVCTGICELVQGDQTTWNLQLTDVLGFLFTQILTMLGGFALATLLLNTPAAIVLFLVYEYLIPGILFTISQVWGAFSDISPYINFIEAQGPLSDWTLNSSGEWAHLIVSGVVWLLLPFTVGLMRILRAEVK